MKRSQYTERQLAIIDGEIPSSEIQIFEYRAILKKAKSIWDDEIIELATVELGKRGLSCTSYKRYTERQLAIIEGDIPIEGVKKNELNGILTKAQDLGDKEAAYIVETELRRREPIRPTDGEYTAIQTDIIQGRIAIEDAPSPDLLSLSEKAKKFDDNQLYNEIYAELSKRKYTVPSSEYYTYGQKEIIYGIKPIEDALPQQLESIINRATRRGDTGIADFADRELDRRAFLFKESNYTKRQMAIINGEIPFDDVDTWDLYLLLKKAKRDYVHNMTDLVKRIEKTIQERGAVVSPMELAYTQRQQDALNGIVDPSTFTEYETECLLTKLAVNGDLDTYQDIVDVLRENYVVKYVVVPELKVHSSWTDRQLRILRREIPLEKAMRRDLNSTLEKAKRLIDPSPVEQLIFDLEEELKRRNGKGVPATGVKGALYTAVLSDVITGRKPVSLIPTEKLEPMERRARLLGETAAADAAKEELDRRRKETDEKSDYSDLQQRIIKDLKGYKPKDRKKPRKADDTPLLYDAIKELRDEEHEWDMEEFEAYRPYTDRQEMILSGEVDLSTIRGNELSAIIKKARAYGDDNQADMLQAILDERESERASLPHKKKLRCYEDDPFESPDDGYTSVQRNIITGKTSYENVNTLSLRNILNTAKKIGDHDVVSLMETLIEEKREDSAENLRRWRHDYYYAKKGEEPPEYNMRDFVNRKTVGWVMDILNSREDPDTATLKDLVTIKTYARKQTEPVYVRVADFLIAERKDESVVYTVSSRREACIVIEINTIQPIRWPEEWFAKDGSWLIE